MDWIEHFDAAGNPVSKRTIKWKCYVLCRRTPSKNWIYRFLEHHPNIKLGWPSGLDPKRDQCFNQRQSRTHAIAVSDENAAPAQPLQVERAVVRRRLNESEHLTTGSGLPASSSGSSTTPVPNFKGPSTSTVYYGTAHTLLPQGHGHPFNPQHNLHDGAPITTHYHNLQLEHCSYHNYLSAQAHYSIAS